MAGYLVTIGNTTYSVSRLFAYLFYVIIIKTKLFIKGNSLGHSKNRHNFSVKVLKTKGD